MGDKCSKDEGPPSDHSPCHSSEESRRRSHQQALISNRLSQPQILDETNSVVDANGDRRPTTRSSTLRRQAHYEADRKNSEKRRVRDEEKEEGEEDYDPSAGHNSIQDRQQHVVSCSAVFSTAHITIDDYVGTQEFELEMLDEAEPLCQLMRAQSGKGYEAFKRCVRAWVLRHRVRKLVALSTTAKQLKELRQHSLVEKEILSSEGRYVESLTVLRDTFLAPISEQIVRPVEVRNAVLALVDRVQDLHVFHQRVFSSFDKRRKCIDEDGQLSLIVIQITGGVGTYYTDYLRLMPFVRDAVAKLTNHPQFAAFMQKVSRVDPRTHGLGLDAYLIQPLRKLAGYQLMFDRLLDSLPEGHIDKLALGRAVRGLKQATCKVDEACKAG